MRAFLIVHRQVHQHRVYDIDRFYAEGFADMLAVKLFVLPDLHVRTKEKLA